MFLGRSYFFIIVKRTVTKSPSLLMFRVTVQAAKVVNREKYKTWAPGMDQVNQNMDRVHGHPFMDSVHGPLFLLPLKLLIKVPMK